MNSDPISGSPDYVEQVCLEFSSSLAGDSPRVLESFLDDSVSRPLVLQKLLRIELLWRLETGNTPVIEEYLGRFPNDHEIVHQVFNEVSNHGSLQTEYLASDLQTIEAQNFFSNSQTELNQSHVSTAGLNGIPDRIGDYVIAREIARGGMGVVYQAKHVTLERSVALKMLLRDEGASTEERQRFKVEALAVAKLDHPGIVPIYDVGETNGQPYFAMAYVDGESLAQRVQREGPMSPRVAVKLVIDIARAIQHAHDKGIVHRDLKPQNVLLDKKGQVQVTDFGLAKHQESGANLTQTGQILGTPAYMPPEQASGRIDQVGVCSDVYAIGATLYFLLTARPPFQAANLHEVLRQVIEAEPVSPRKLDPSLSRDLETICLKSLAKSPSGRYQSAALLADDLVRWLNGETILARPTNSIEKAWKWCRRKPVAAGLMATVILATVLSFFVALLVNERRYADAENRAKNESLLLSVESGLQSVRKYLTDDDYGSAKSELQRVSGLVSGLQDQDEWLNAVQHLSNQLNAISDFEIARVQRCGMPSCQFDYANYSPMEILQDLSLDIRNASPAVLANQISEEDIKDEIIAALDDWAWVLSECSFDQYREYLPKIVQTCNLLDPEPTRIEIRNSLVDGQNVEDVAIPDISSESLSQMQPPAILFLANTLVRARKLEPAVELLQRSAVIYPNDFWINLRLSEITRMLGKPYQNLTRTHLEVARALRPTNHVILNNLASLYVDSGNDEMAKQMLVFAIQKNPSDPNLRHSLAIAEFDQNQNSVNVEPMYEATIKDFPNFVQSYINLAILKIRRDQLDEAEKLLNMAYEIQSKKCDVPSPDHADLHNLALILMTQAKMAQSNDNVEEASKLRLDTLELLRKILPSDKDGTYENRLANMLYETADQAESDGDFALRLELLTEASSLKNAEVYSKVLLELAVFQSEVDELPTALEYIDLAVAVIPSGDAMIDANVLVWGAMLQGKRLTELQEDESTSTDERADASNKAIQYLEKASDLGFFQPLDFGVMLSTRDDFRPFDDLSGFWNVVLSNLQRGIAEKPEEANSPQSPSLYFAARTAVVLAALLGEEVDGDAADSKKLRTQANQWIRSKLDCLQVALAEGTVTKSYVENALSLWLTDSSWESVRDSEKLAELEPAERESWEQFWSDVSATRSDD